MKSTKLFFGVLFALALSCFAVAAFAQNQDVNPYGGIYYNDHSNYRMSGANGLPRTDRANIDTLTNVLKGDLRFDTLNSVVVVYDGTAWVNLEGGGNSLDQAYDKGGAGVGRTITADAGAVEVVGNLTAISGDYGLINDSMRINAGIGNFRFAGARAYDSNNNTLVWSGVFDIAGDKIASIHCYDTITGQESEVSTNYFSTIGKQGVLVKSNGTTGQSMTGINVLDEVTVFARDTTAAPAFNIMSWDSSASDSLTVFSVSRKGKVTINDQTQADGYVLTSDASGNADWQANDPGTGWASYTDATWTVGSPFSVTQGDNDKMPFFWETVVDPQLPTGVDSLFNRLDTTLVGFNGDAYSVRIQFKAKTSVNNGYASISFDIGTPASPIVITKRVVTFPRGSNIEHNFSITTDLFAGSTFESNGCSVFLEAGSGNLSMYDINVMITRTHKAK